MHECYLKYVSVCVYVSVTVTEQADKIYAVPNKGTTFDCTHGSVPPPSAHRLSERPTRR